MQRVNPFGEGDEGVSLPQTKGQASRQRLRVVVVVVWCGGGLVAFLPSGAFVFWEGGVRGWRQARLKGRGGLAGCGRGGPGTPPLPPKPLTVNPR